MQPDAISLVLAAVVAWLAIGALGIAGLRKLRFVSRVLFPAGAGVGIALAVVAFLAIGAPANAVVLPFGLPDLPFHLRIDALSAFFLVLLGAVSAAISLFSAGYFRSSEGTPPGLICFQYHVFLAAMALVLVADDAYAFMVAWEAMALASYFLVTTEHRIPEIRRAGFLYLLIAHVGAIGILLCFGVLQGGSGDYTFAGMRAATLSPAWASIGFFLALFGFGAKAGILPLHVWLPEAHPAAPSPVSALMSGVMLKTAIYGLLRVAFDLLQLQLWWWGVVALAFGLVTALFGVIFAAAQTDMKRLLAYSSIENIGIIVSGIGLAILFKAYDKPTLAAIALTAALYHALNHAFFKSLLFLATGAVLHATHERSLGKLGGLIHRMPWVAWLALVGTLAIAGLPPLNGFVSEWLLLQAFLFTPTLPQSFVNMLVPIAAAALVLAAALAAYVMVKFYGVIFLGRPREANLAYAKDAGKHERLALSLLAAGCVLLGIFPGFVIHTLDPVNVLLVGSAVGEAAGNWLMLAPFGEDRSSYSPLIVLVVIVAVVLVTMQVVHRYYHGRVRRADPWDCGYPLQTPRMQDTAEGFGQPVRQVFEPFFRIERELPTPFDAKPRYQVDASDPWWNWIYVPVARAAELAARFVGLIQQGRISVYLTYSFVTLLALLFLVR
ncbi:MAG: hydrogenase 4 subunit B [Burkholderiales bacterium]|jgi:hydrogenase-4 component B|nr:hydrogenase 4 subunit B [Burkholderiales bacterium]MBP8139933.1 hydrogenase 4 subunit B [Burkholderiales bacterium]